MKYKFSYQTNALDVWLLAMTSTYSSMAGMSNIIFSVAMLILTVTFWNQTNYILKIVFLLLVCLFPIIQPIAIYVRAKKQVAVLPEEMEVSFSDQGVQVKTEQEVSNIKWNTIKGVSKKTNMVVIHSTVEHGFMIPNRILKEEKEEFYRYILSKLKKNATK